jgi:protein FAM32A
MANDEYFSTGGALKLKGAKVTKPKKKKKPKQPDPVDEPSASHDSHKDPVDSQEAPVADLQAPKSPNALNDTSTSHLRDEEDLLRAEIEQEKMYGRFLTDAERKHQETRRRRLLEQAKTQPVKTHREKVEELNKKLSRQPEHNDMHVLQTLLELPTILLTFFLGQRLVLANQHPSSMDVAVQGASYPWNTWQVAPRGRCVSKLEEAWGGRFLAGFRRRMT